MADLVERADDDIIRLLAQLVKAHPGEALRMLLETGALVQFSDCGHCVGREDCRFVDPLGRLAEGIPECVPVYRLADEEST